jgi:hypothetical protein
MGLRFLDLAKGDGDKIEAWIGEQTTKFTG